MLKVPKTPWPVRVVALILGCGMSLYILQMYSFGSKFGVLIGNYLRPPAAVVSSGIPSLQGEPGVVPVSILSDPKAAKK